RTDPAPSNWRKPRKVEDSFFWFEERGLPLIVGRSLEGGGGAGMGMDVNKSCAGLLRTQDYAVELQIPVCCAGYRILGNSPEVASLGQIVERLRRGLLVERVVVDGLTHGLKILFQ